MIDRDSPAASVTGAQEAEAAPSRSRRRREHRALQTLAEQLLALPRGELEGLGFGERTWAAIDETARISDPRALRRHVKRVANCLARENTRPLQDLLEARAAQVRGAAALHHRIERWRERLLAEGDPALAEFIDAYPGAERQELRALVRAARRDAERGRAEAPRRLFRALRALLAAHEEAAGGG